MHSKLTNCLCKGLLTVFVLGLALVGEERVPKDRSLGPGFGSNSDLSSTSRFSTGKFSARKSATGLSGLPADAQPLVAAALGKDDPTYGLQQNPQGFRGEDSQQALVTNPWIQTARLIASDASPSNLFGASVAMNGSTLVVGAPYRNGDRGAAYVFVKSGGTWIQQAELTSSDGGELDHFGTSVAVSGTTVIVGAPYHTVGSNNEQGAAYVFVKSGETWIQQAELTASDGAIFDNFGWSVAVSGTTAVVGAFDKVVGSKVGAA
jgi:hypothetical protein